MKEVVFLVLLLISTASFSAELFFNGVTDVVPFAWIENGTQKGFAVEIFHEIAKRMKITAKIELLPFNRALRYLESGSSDGIFQIYHNKKREDFLIYSKLPVYTVQYFLFTKKGKEFPFNSMTDLYGKNIGIPLGYFISKEFSKAVEERNILLNESSNTEMSLIKLNNGGVDAIASDDKKSRYYINKLNLTDKIVRLPNPLLSKKDTFLALSKKGKNIVDKKKFIEKVNQVMQQMHDDGTYKKIADKYFK